MTVPMSSVLGNGVGVKGAGEKCTRTSGSSFGHRERAEIVS